MSEQEAAVQTKLIGDLELELLTKMLEKCAFSAENGGSRFEKNINREKHKKFFETVASAIQSRRKAYRADFDESKSEVPNWHRIKSSITLRTYEEFPLQIADIIYQGLKHPLDEIRGFCLALLDARTEKIGVDIFLLIKILQSDWVDNLTWELIYKHKDKMGKFRDVIHPLITQKARGGRDMDSEIVNRIISELIVELRPRY